MEYKSPEDHLDIDAFYKAGAYASLYKSYGKTADDRKADDITVSMVRESKPNGLFQYFKEHNILVANPHDGIYYILDGVLFPTQIIVTKELDKGNHTWLKALSGKLQKQDMKELLETISALTQALDKELADSVLEVSVRANRQLLEEMRGDDSMCNALLEIMEPEIREIEKKSNITNIIEVLREYDHSDDEIKDTIMRKYKLSLKEAEMYLK